MTLQQFLKDYPKAAIAFSGGVDSAYLLYVAAKEAIDVHAYYVKTAFQPVFEYEDALAFARQYNINLTVIETDILNEVKVAENGTDRCYYCKKKLFQQILRFAKKDGYEVLFDGTNASDEETDRPGMKALKELEVHSPLKKCGLTKEMIREESKREGLFTWDKPAYACLATRIPSGEIITQEKLAKTEAAESYLTSLGYTDFRIRQIHGVAKIQIRKEQMEKLFSEREQIVKKLKKYYPAVLLDLEGR